MLALVIYVAAAGIVAFLVDRVGRSRLDAARARAEAEAMAALAGSLAEEEALPALVAHLRTTFGMRSATLFRRDGDGSGGSRRPPAAPPPPIPTTADVVKELNRDLVLTLSGGELGRRRPAGSSARWPPSWRRRVEARRLTDAGRPGRGPGRGQRPPRRPPPGGVARPPDPAGLDQGVDQQRPPGRRQLDAGRAGRVPRHDRGGGRPPRRPRRQPARHEPAPGRRPERRRAPRRPRGGHPRRPGQPRRPGPARWSTPCRTTWLPSAPIPPSSNGPSPTWSATP